MSDGTIHPMVEGGMLIYSISVACLFIKKGVETIIPQLQCEHKRTKERDVDEILIGGAYIGAGIFGLGMVIALLTEAET